MNHKDYKNIPLILLGFLVIFIWLMPILFTSGKTGIFDWDTGMQRFEAKRLSILEYGQWPGFNPWIEGGQPLLSSPGGTILSIEGFLVLLLGTFWGLRFSVLIYTMIGFLGAWKLSKIFWQESFLRFVFALYIIANTAVAYHVAVGHLTFLNYWYMPWLFYYILRIKEDKWSGLKAGIVYGIAFVSSAMYIVQYAALISLGLFFWLWLKSQREDLRAFWNWILLFLPVFGALTFYRLTTILIIAQDFPRINNWQVHFDLLSLLRYYFYPYTELSFPKTVGNLSSPWELCCYVGFTSAILLVVSLKKGLKWWHVILVILVLAVAGNDKIYFPMYWIRKIPSFSSQGCFMRIRMFIPLFSGICSVWGLSYLWSSWGTHKAGRYMILLLGVLMVSEVLVVSHKILKLSHVSLAYTGEYNPGREFKNISKLLRSQDIPWSVNLTYSAIRMNLGWLRGFGESYIPASNIRVGMDDPGYIGEYCQNGKAVEPVYWSPNRLVFDKLEPAVSLVLNINPGRAWYSNGKQLFPYYKIVEPDKPFEVMPDFQGRVDLIYHYPGQKLGIIGTLVFIILVLIVVKRTNRNIVPGGKRID